MTVVISEAKMKIIIDNYFKTECDVNTSIREAFEKGFRVGVEKGKNLKLESHWISVKDRLPTKSGEYIVTGKWKDTPRTYWICTFYSSLGSVQCRGWANDALNPVVEAWMPLPEPPEEEE